ncbi:MAG: dienelactone hydrolase family protein [Alistipes sp.]|nr:dienelactone hydrolase family protein [Alistipes sp.]
MKKILFLISMIAPVLVNGQNSGMTWGQEREKLLELLGHMPARPELNTQYIDTVALDGGVRYKIRYLSQEADPVLGLPEDWVYAYLFGPENHTGGKFAAMIAGHQDDISFHMGKDEPAGLDGKESMYYGLHLFERGYVVLCPDRYYHAERRNFDKSPWFEFDEPDYDRDFRLFDNHVGTLMLAGSTHYSKEAYDLSRAVDLLCSLPYVDRERIGTIGHSAGGVAAVHGAFYDERIALTVSSCGVYDITRVFHYSTPVPFPALMSMPGLVKERYTTADFVRHIYPRSLIMTRGAYEWGEGDPNSEKFVSEVEGFAVGYRSGGTEGDVTVIVFDEQGGEHDFPAGVREEVYNMIDERFKK